MRWIPLALLLTGCASAVRARDHLPTFTEQSGMRLSEHILTSDGITLKTVVQLPRGEGPWPVVLMRSPYPIDPILAIRCGVLTRYGYACVRQDTRGQGGSGGSWDPFRSERADGMRTLDWIDEQPWSDGNVAMHGESYLGAVQWLLAPQPHPTLKTLIPSVFGTDLRDAAFEGGLLRHDLITTWAALMPTRGLRVFAGERYRRSLKHRPRRTADMVFAGQKVPWYRMWMEGADADAPVWQDPLAQAAMITPSLTQLPVLMMGGWGDAFLGPQISSWQQLASQDQSVLVVGPWSHIGGRTTSGPRPGLRSELGAGGRLSQWPRVLDWLDHQLRGQPLDMALGVYTYPVHGENWTHHTSWPPEANTLSLYPNQGRGPQACAGGLSPISTSGTASWTYDPKHPTPTIGGAGMLAGLLPGFGPVRPGFWNEPAEFCARHDDLIGFYSASLPGPLHIAGKIEADLRVRADVADTGLMVRVLELRADGTRRLVQEGLSSLSMAASDTAPNTWTTAHLVTWPIETVIAQGSHIAVEFGSASFPRVEAHPNVATSWIDAVATPIAHIQLDLSETVVRLPIFAGSL